MVQHNLNVQGMTCTSCEVLIERALKNVPGVKNVHVSRAKEEAIVECSDQVSLDQLQQAVKERGYTLAFKNSGNTASTATHSPSNSSLSKQSPFLSRLISSKERYAEIGAVLVIIAGLYLILNQLNLIPQNFGVSDTMSYGFIFLLGLVAAVSTCLAVSGGLLLAVAEKYTQKYAHATRFQKFQPHLYFNAGRLVSYVAFGALIGLFGSAITLSPFVTGTITILASLVMVLLGLQLLHLFPLLDKIQIKMPKILAHKLYDASAQQSDRSIRTKSFLFGAGTFFLPCGFTLSLQLYVLSKADPVIGGLTMLAFSLGTLPSLLSIGAISSYSKGPFKRYFTTFSAVLVIILGVYNLPNGLSLTGAAIGVNSLDFFAASETPPLNVLPSGVNDENVKLVDGKQIVEMKVAGLDYLPAKFTLLQGVPVEWRVDGRQAQGCAQILSVPSLGITESLPRDRVKTITFTPSKVGSIKFSCSMGMAGPGLFTVVPAVT